MATASISNIPVGAAVVSIGAWVTNAGAGSLTTVGYTHGGVELHDKADDFSIESDQTQGVLRSIPIKKVPTLKIPLIQADLDLLQLVMRQVSGNLTGASPNKTMIVDQEIETYFQVTVVGKGISGGTTYATRTWTIWRAICKNRDAIMMSKDKISAPHIELEILEDDSITANMTGKGRFYKVVDSGGV